ncbi:hypothetical protein [Paraburkholderia translucens]|uniref:hypothetical protein n=1 Tax=Paraburkholderia translucens TaxID=2886945 RepID=UPI001E3F6282|nr:hypothetical protein [Paraburkholderia sp. MMS20-SJTN17]
MPETMAFGVEQQARMASEPRTGNGNRIHDVPARPLRIDERQMGACRRELFSDVMKAVNHLESAFAATPDARDDEAPASRHFPQRDGAPIGQQ